MLECGDLTLMANINFTTLLSHFPLLKGRGGGENRMRKKKKKELLIIYLKRKEKNVQMNNRQTKKQAKFV